MAGQVVIDDVKNVYQLWAAGDPQAVPTLMTMLSDDIKWCSLANGCKGAEFTRESNGKDEVMQYFAGLASDWEMVHFTVNEFVSERDMIVMLGSCCFKHRRTGKQVDTPKVDTVRVKDGAISEFTEFYDTAAMLAAAL